MLRITQLSGEELTSLPLAELSDVKALKQRSSREHGLPPRFRQRLLHEGNTLDDAVKLETEMDLQVSWHFPRFRWTSNKSYTKRHPKATWPRQGVRY